MIENSILIGSNGTGTTGNTSGSAGNRKNSKSSLIKSLIDTTTFQEKYFTLEEVSKHKTKTDLWMIINNDVYDFTTFFELHPGGDIILEGAGKDATYLFEDIGHSYEAVEMLSKYKIGRLSAK